MNFLDTSKEACWNVPHMTQSSATSCLKVLLVVGNRSPKSTTRTVVKHLGKQLAKAGCDVDLFDYTEIDLPLFDVQSAFSGTGYAQLKQRVQVADVIVLGTPDYHGSMSSALKNFLDHFWNEFAGKLFGSIVGSHEKGLTVFDQMRTVMRQCYAWPLPYGVSFQDKTDIEGDVVVSDVLLGKLDAMTRDLCVYGQLLAGQRQKDLAGKEPGFLAHYRQ